MQVNTDGLPLFRSSAKQPWTILGKFPFERDPFVIGVSCGMTCSGGSHIGASFTVAERTSQLALNCFICDVPAQTFIKHRGMHTTVGVTVAFKMDPIWGEKLLFLKLNLPEEQMYRLVFLQINAISRKHLGMSQYIPCEFARRPRSLSELDHWKATGPVEIVQELVQAF